MEASSGPRLLVNRERRLRIRSAQGSGCAGAPANKRRRCERRREWVGCPVWGIAVRACCTEVISRMYMAVVADICEFFDADAATM